MPGVGRLLAGTDVTVVPARIRGTFEALPRDRSWPRPHPVTIVFGAALTPAELEATGSGDTPETRIAAALRDAVAALPEP